MTDTQHVGGASAQPQPTSISSSHWTIRRGAEEFVAPSLEELLRWSRDGRVVASDLVFHPSLATWMPARDVPPLCGVLPRSHSTMKRLLLVIAAVMAVPLIGIGACTGLAVLGAAVDATKPVQAEVTLRMQGENATGEIRNVGTEELRDVRLLFEWTSAGKVMSKVDAGTIPSMKPGNAVDLELTPVETGLGMPKIAEPFKDPAWGTMDDRTQRRLLDTYDKQMQGAQEVYRHRLSEALSKPPRLRVFTGSKEVKSKLIDTTSNERSAVDGSGRDE